MKTVSTDSMIRARELIDLFLSRTGILTEGVPDDRYLWTDAFAVQTCFALKQNGLGSEYADHALQLIDRVHAVLGQHRSDDSRTGWISGLPEPEGTLHPTAKGLRIGKKLPERGPGEPFSQTLEWKRDGQYFHYLTRWFNAMLQAGVETGRHDFYLWAAELIKAGEKFIDLTGGRLHMYWKMNVDLSYPVVSSMGAHDPLEGLVCVLTAMQALPEKADELGSLRVDLESICRGMEWTTTDALGIGGLCLNIARVAALQETGVEIPRSIHPEQLYREGMAGLKVYAQQLFDPLRPANERLAFRECGLSLGLRVLYGLRDRFPDLIPSGSEAGEWLTLAAGVEEFWLKPENQRALSWKDHENINTVMLAASLAAATYPEAYCGLTHMDPQ